MQTDLDGRAQMRTKRGNQIQKPQGLHRAIDYPRLIGLDQQNANWAIQHHRKVSTRLDHIVAPWCKRVLTMRAGQDTAVDF